MNSTENCADVRPRYPSAMNHKAVECHKHGQAWLNSQTDWHHSLTLASIMFLTFLVCSNRSFQVPSKLDGSGKPQCSRWVTPGNTGQRSALVSSQTVMTY